MPPHPTWDGIHGFLLGWSACAVLTGMATWWALGTRPHETHWTVAPPGDADRAARPASTTDMPSSRMKKDVPIMTPTNAKHGVDMSGIDTGKHGEHAKQIEETGHAMAAVAAGRPRMEVFVRAQIAKLRADADTLEKNLPALLDGTFAA